MVFKNQSKNKEKLINFDQKFRAKMRVEMPRKRRKNAVNAVFRPAKAIKREVRGGPNLIKKPVIDALCETCNGPISINKNPAQKSIKKR